jgi:hypothetical protein
MATKASAPAKKNQDNAEANRMARLLRTQKTQPNNKQIDAALKTTRMHRKTPVNPAWTSQWRMTAQLFKLFGGRFDPACMSSNVETARNAMARQSVYAAITKAPQYPANAFSIEARLQGGAASWN